MLVLLPSSTTKLAAQWQGPYQIERCVGKVTYLVDMHDKRKRKRVFHVNVLREFNVHKATCSAYWTEEVPPSDQDADVPVWNEKCRWW